jgi:4-amino-4-deoxy-L-arabinose transferase-like glycosyltransferase
MVRHLYARLGPYALLLAVAAALTLPNLGQPSLWDIDEGNNASCGYEMNEAGNWVVPTFNYRLRVDKPALLYWLQIAAGRSFGFNEFSARLPSALAALAGVLLTYELARRLFGRGPALLAGLALAGNVGYCAAAHFANPDALLTACSVLTLLLFWRAYVRGGWWFVPAGAAAGLAVLAKGPVGLVLPGAVACLFLLVTGNLRRLLDPRLLLGLLAFALVALPWYAWVGIETKGEFLEGFLFKHNVDRFLHPMENHPGPFWYYGVVLLLGFLPWSVFLGLGLWHGVADWRAERLRDREQSPPAGPAPRHAHVFLWCWVAVYLVFFTASGTKLPNYVLPLYPALAVLTGRFLERWRLGLVRPPAWAVAVSLGSLAAAGVGVSVAVLVVSGRLPGAAIRGGPWAGLEPWALLGLVPVATAAAAGWCVRCGRLRLVPAVLCVGAVLFVGVLAGWGSGVAEARKAPRELAEALGPDRTTTEIRVGAYAYFQPSLVFYCRREVLPMRSARQAVELLEGPLPAYLFVPAAVWEKELRQAAPASCRLLASRHDLYRNCDVVVVTNR